jgi:hypothetical protein
VDELMRQMAGRRVVTINELRGALAQKQRADMAYPITTGIFSCMAAYAADEAEKMAQSGSLPIGEH